MGLFFVLLPTLQTYGHTDKHLHFQAFLPRTYRKELLQTKWFEMFVDAKEESGSSGLPKWCKSEISYTRTEVRMRLAVHFYGPSQ